MSRSPWFHTNMASAHKTWPCRRDATWANNEFEKLWLKQWELPKAMSGTKNLRIIILIGQRSWLLLFTLATLNYSSCCFFKERLGNLWQGPIVTLAPMTWLLRRGAVRSNIVFKELWRDIEICQKARLEEKQRFHLWIIILTLTSPELNFSSCCFFRERSRHLWNFTNMTAVHGNWPCMNDSIAANSKFI